MNEPSPAAGSEPARTSEPDPHACLRCGGLIESMGVEPFRVGGTGGGWKLLFGELAELGEGMLAMEVLACPACGHVELRLPPRR